MSSTPQVVPSKNALRALRKLALGGTTVVGAVGSVCGLAFVSYDIRQRIYLAESIVETKKVLHSQPVYNTSRKAHMATIFEMYENGQGKEESESWRDFNRRARKHFKQQNTHPGGLELSDTNIKSDETLPADSCKKTTGSKVSSQRDLNSSTAQRIIEATQKQHKVDSHTVYGRPRESRNVSPVLKIVTAAQQQHKVQSHGVYGRPHKTKDAALPQLANSVREWLSPSSGKRQRASHAITFSRPNTSCQPTPNHALTRHYSTSVKETQLESKPPFVWPLSIDSSQYVDPFFRNDAAVSETTEGQKTRDIELVPLSPAHRPPIDGTSDQTQHTSQGININRLDIAKSEVFGSIERHEGPGAGFVLASPSHRAGSDITPKHAQVSSQDIYVAGLDFAIGGLSTLLPDVSRELMILMEHHLFRPDESGDHKHQPVKDIASFPGPSTSDTIRSSDQPLLADSLDTRDFRSARSVTATETSGETFEPSALVAQLITVIDTVRYEKGSEAARKLATQAIDIYAARGTLEDLHAIDDISLQFGKELRLSMQSKAMCQLIHHLLNTDLEEDRERAGRLLFYRGLDDMKTDDRSNKVIGYQYERQARGYIEWLCSADVSSFKVVREFRKVIEIVYERGVPPGEGLFAPLLRRFLARGELKYLCKTFEEMEAAHAIVASGHTRKLLLLAFAKAHDWEQITTEFEKMHRDGISRKEPMSYATLFNEVFREYAISEPVEKVHDFVVNAICYWGLVPTSPVSATAVAAYIRHRRYDLIREWNEAIGQMYTQVTIRGNRFTLMLANTWEEIGASCEEIEEACMSILLGSDNVVPPRFRNIVQEALAGHLATKIHDTKSDGEASKNLVGESGEADDLSLQLKSAFAVILEDAGESGVVMRGSVADLLDQSNAALRLRTFLGAQTDIATPEVTRAIRLERPVRTHVMSKSEAVSRPVPPELRRELLPDRATVVSLVSNYYSQFLKRGERVDHAILTLTCRQLSLAQRQYDMAALIWHIYQGPAVQGPDGIMFDISVIQLWMETAYSLKSPIVCRQIFCAILEKGTAIRLTHRFILLAEMALHKAFGAEFSHRHKSLKIMQVELKHLLSLISDRFYLQRKVVGPKRRKERLSGMLALTGTRLRTY